MGRPRIVMLTNIPSYHQVDLFDTLAREDAFELEVHYLYDITQGRHWTRMPRPQHPAVRLPHRKVGPVTVHPTLRRELAKAAPDLVIVGQYAALAYQQAMYASTLRRRPWVFWAEPMGVKHFEVKSRLPRWLRQPLRQAAFWPAARFASGLWGIGINAQRQYAEISGRPAENFPYFSDLTRFARHGQGYAPDGVVRLLFAGRFSFRKGFDTLLEAAGRLLDMPDLPPWHLTLHGRGEMGERLEALPQALRSRITDGGFLELADMPEAMRGHDVFVAPSRYDGWGMVVPEALAAGMPVVTTFDMGSATDIGELHPTPLVTQVDAGDARSLAAALAARIRARDALAAMAPEAVATAMHYDVGRCAERFGDLVDKALTAR